MVAAAPTSARSRFAEPTLFCRLRRSGRTLSRKRQDVFLPTLDEAPMTQFVRAAAALFLCAGLAPAADHSIKIDKASPPKEVSDTARPLLGEECIHFLDGKGKAIADLWFRKE